MSDERLNLIEIRVRDLEKGQALIREDMAANREVTNEIKNQLIQIHSNTSWIVRIILGAILVAIMQFAITGGFSAG